MLDLPVSQLRAVPDHRALKFCCLCCPAHICWASSETPTLLKVSQARDIPDRPFHIQQCRGFLTKLGCRSGLINSSVLSLAMATSMEIRDTIFLVWSWTSFSLNKKFNGACEQSFTFLTLHEICDADIRFLKLTSILSLAGVGTRAVALGQVALEQDSEESDSACLLWFFPRLLIIAGDTK